MNRNLLILTAVLVVGAAAALVIQPGGKRKSGADRPKEIMKSADVLRIDEFSIGELVIKRDERKRWLGSDFVADGKKVGEFFDRIVETKIIDEMPRTQDDSKEYGFAGAKLVKLSSNGESFVEIQIGDDSAKGGQYLRLNDDSRVLLIGTKLDANTEASSWERKSLLALEAEEVKSVAFFLGGSNVRHLASREKKDEDLQLKDPKKGSRASPGVKRFANLFGNISFEEKIDPSNEEAKTALANGSHAVEVETFGASRYRLRIGEIGKDDAKKYFLKVEVLEEGKSLNEVQKLELDTLREMGSKWVFQISKYQGGQLRKETKDFYEADKKS